jgi:phosphomannomutase
VLSLIVERGGRLSDVVDAYPRYAMLKGEVPLAASKMPAVLARLRERYATGPASGSAMVVDGLRVDWPDRWFHVRVSQTEPIVRVICEQRGDAPEALHASVLEEVRRG